MEVNQFPYTIRWALPEDWDPAMDMVWRTFLKFEGKDYSQEGIDNFDTFIHDGTLRKLFLKGRYQVLVALDGGRVVGLASVRNGNHLSLLFVDEKYHKMGVGRRLIEYVSDYVLHEEGHHAITVNAAPYAVEFYHKVGFYDTDKEESNDGIRYTPMERVIG